MLTSNLTVTLVNAPLQDQRTPQNQRRTTTPQCKAIFRRRHDRAPAYASARASRLTRHSWMVISLCPSAQHDATLRRFGSEVDNDCKPIQSGAITRAFRKEGCRRLYLSRGRTGRPRVSPCPPRRRSTSASASGTWTTSAGCRSPPAHGTDVLKDNKDLAPQPLPKLCTPIGHRSPAQQSLQAKLVQCAVTPSVQALRPVCGGSGDLAERGAGARAWCWGPMRSTSSTSASLFRPPCRLSQNFIRYLMSYTVGK